MTKEEWLADLKARALELARAGDLQHAVSICGVEINRRPDMKVHHAFVLAGTMKAMNEDSAGVIEWIESISDGSSAPR
jgi:hypothetical protein